MVLAAAPKAISDAAREQRPRATPDLCATGVISALGVGLGRDADSAPRL